MANRLFVLGNEFPLTGLNRIFIFNFLSSVIKYLGINISLFFMPVLNIFYFSRMNFLFSTKLPAFN